MSISDEMMWRYYELLTDVQLPEIEKLKREAHPMQAKKDLARRIVADFHSAEAAAKADQDWAKQFQKDEVPEELDRVVVSLDAVALSGVKQVVGGHSSNANLKPVRVGKLTCMAGLTASNTEAVGKYKQGAVALLDGNMQPMGISPSLAAWVPLDTDLILRVGRRMKKVRIVDQSSDQ